MHSIKEDIEEFNRQLGKGAIQRGYRALLSYMMGLRTHFKNKYPDVFLSSLYQGYFDMTYFAISPQSFKQRDLKLAIVFNYEAFRFEVWLVGRNRKINRQYWELLKDRKLPEYRIITPGKGVDSIIEYDLAHGFDLIDMDILTKKIEKGTDTFIKNINALLTSSVM